MRQYLQHLPDDAGVGDEIGDVHDEVTAAIRAVDGWLAAGHSAALDDARWAALAGGPAFTAPDLGAVQHGEALPVLPHDLAAALAELERDADALATCRRVRHRRVWPACARPADVAGYPRIATTRRIGTASTARTRDAARSQTPARR